MNNTLQECYKYYVDLREEMDQWLEQSMALDPPGPNGGGEDEANYALSWFPHYLVTGDKTVLKHFGDLKSALAGWVERECLHGYEPEAEAHHGTEPFLLFLPRYIDLVPDDQEARSMLMDAAEHIGNWVEEIPAWYDYDRDNFWAITLASRTVHNDAATAYELAEHFRFIHIALAAYRIAGEERYLDWSLRYGRKRAERIIAAESPMPLLWIWTETAWAKQKPKKEIYTGLLLNGTHHLSGDPLAGIENLLASGAIYALGDLYHLSKDTISEMQQSGLSSHSLNPYLTRTMIPLPPQSVTIGRTFQDTTFDQPMRGQLVGMPPIPRHLALIFPQEVRRRELGVGRRADMAYWGEWSDDGSVQPIREPSTAAMTLAYQLSGNPEFATRAFQSASRRLKIARRVLRGGRGTRRYGWRCLLSRSGTRTELGTWSRHIVLRAASAWYA